MASISVRPLPWRSRGEDADTWKDADKSSSISKQLAIKIPLPPPRTTLRSSSSENLSAKHLWPDCLTEPMQWHEGGNTHTNSRNLEHEELLQVNGGEGPLFEEDTVEKVNGERPKINGRSVSKLEFSSYMDPLLYKATGSCTNCCSNEREHTFRERKQMDREMLSKEVVLDSLKQIDWEMLSIEEVLDFLKQMSSMEAPGSSEEMPEPVLAHVFIHIMTKCRKKFSLAQTRCLHLHICNNGLEDHPSLQNCLISLYLECGSLPGAQQLFNRSSKVDGQTWNSLIEAYVETGELQCALNLYASMRECCTHLSRHAIMGLLKACAKLQDLEQGQKLHTDFAKEGFEIDSYVSNTLVDMYAKCGLIIEAKSVFDCSPVQDTVLWSTLVRCYAELGLFKEVLETFQQMRVEGVNADAVIFICSLKACSIIKDINTGREVHAEIVKYGFEEHSNIGNALVDIYAKCGSLEEARKVFHSLSAQDVVSWTTLISGYANHELDVEALNFLEQMQEAGLSPNSVTFLCSLKASGRLGAITKGQWIHSQIIKQELETDVIIGSALVGMYAKCGLMAEAQAIFDELPVRNVVSWTALLAGYADCGLGRKALKCLKQMQLQGVAPNSVSFLCILRNCNSIEDREKGRILHSEVVKRGFEGDNNIGSALVNLYGKCGLPEEARVLFDKLLVRNVVAWTVLISGYTEHGSSEEALQLLEKMQLEGVLPDTGTYIYCLKACGNLGDAYRGQQLHAEISMKGLDEAPFLASTLVEMYADIGMLAEAENVFENLAVRDVALWNVIIIGYTEHRYIEDAINCLEEMELEGVSPDFVSFVCVLRGCMDADCIDRGRIVHSEILKRGIEKHYEAVGSTLVEMYAVHCLFTEAWNVFNKLPSGSSLSWSAIIARLC